MPIAPWGDRRICVSDTAGGLSLPQHLGPVPEQEQARYYKDWRKATACVECGWVNTTSLWRTVPPSKGHPATALQLRYWWDVPPKSAVKKAVYYHRSESSEPCPHCGRYNEDWNTNPHWVEVSARFVVAERQWHVRFPSQVMTVTETAPARRPPPVLPVLWGLFVGVFFGVVNAETFLSFLAWVFQ